MQNLASFLEAATPLAREVNTFAQRYNAARLGVIDHFCYKCGDHEEYLRLKDMLAKESRFVNETPISGRMIATIGLNPKETEHPLAFSCSFGDCYTLELSDQKPNGSQKSGFDHIEILPVARSYESLLAQLQQKGISFTEVGRPHHTTHDHTLPGEFTLRLTREALLYKIGVEMQQLPWK